MRIYYTIIGINDPDITYVYTQVWLWTYVFRFPTHFPVRATSKKIPLLILHLKQCSRSELRHHLRLPPHPPGPRAAPAQEMAPQNSKHDTLRGTVPLVSQLLASHSSCAEEVGQE